MIKAEGLTKGINLGGWFSQCEYSKEHFDSFITKDDFQRIASWGLDHVRLPVDYNLFQNSDGGIIETNFHYIDACISWCKEFGLKIILDLHKAKGFSFDSYENEAGLFVNENLRRQFKTLWTEFAKRYRNEEIVNFELLNEVVNPEDNENWMQLAKETVAIIRNYAPAKRILIGGYHNNSVTAIKDLALPFDKNIVYTFHCYEPLLFTHQGAYWCPEMEPSFRMKYPLSKEEYEKELTNGVGDAYRFKIADHALTKDKFNAQYFENLFHEAINTAQERDVQLYCGEYGVIDRADVKSSLNWLRDINSTFKKFNISRAIWNYKGKDFGLTDNRFDSVRDELNSLL